MAVIQLRNISKRFEHMQALASLSLDIADGEFLVLVGPSGCGKSTLLRMLAGLEDVSDGQILLGDDDITAWSPKQRNFSMIFQNYALFPHLTVEQNITLVCGCAVNRKRSIHSGYSASPVCSSLSHYSNASRGNCPAASVSAWRWRERSCAIHACF